MMSELRAVLDTAVVVSAVLLPRSVPRQAFDLVASHGRLLISEATIAELEEVLRRPKFDRYIQQEERLEFLAALVRDAEIVKVTHQVKACRDPKDDKFLAGAASISRHRHSHPTSLPRQFPGSESPAQVSASVVSGELRKPSHKVLYHW